MLGERLVDLDELVLRCRDDQARQYIAEAVACYKVGAIRSSIVATWIAIIFDFIYKLRELELTGDINAKQKLAEFEKIRGSNDVSGSLNFEKRILDLAKDTFQLLSPLEYADLSRLLEDRNRCAHPSMNSIEDIYQPPAELARYHLRNAVSYLLQRPPVQGKAAIEWLLNEVHSVYFPNTVEAAVKSFSIGPLNRPTDALVRNFVIVLVKNILFNDLDDASARRHYAAINAVREIHRVITEKALADKLNDIFKTLPDEKFGMAMRFLYFMPDTWQFTNDVRIRMITYVNNMPTQDITPNLLFALQTKELKTPAQARMSHISREELAALIAADTQSKLTDEFVDPAISLYEKAGNYYYANSMVEHLVLPLINSLSLVSRQV